MIRAVIGAAAPAVLATTLAACGGGGGGGSDAQQIRDAITAFTSKRTCTVLDDKARQSLVGETDLALCNHALSLNAAPPKYSITSVTVNGTSASAHIQGPSTDRTVSMVKQGSKWLIDDVSQSTGSGSTANTTSGPATASTSAPAGGAASAAKTEYITALRGLEAGSRRYNARATPDLQAQNLTAARADTAQFRTAVFNFDKRVRAISFPPAAQADVQTLLADDATLIGDLDSAAAASSFQEFARLIQRANSDTSTLASNFQKVGKDLP